MSRLPLSFLKAPIAHRGLHDHECGVIENSLSAVRAAIRRGYGIEIDVQCTLDERAAVFHDVRLGRVTEVEGLVQARKLKDLQQIRLTGSTDTIPSLEEVLSVVDGQVPLLVELKDIDGRMRALAVGPLEQAVAGALRDYKGDVAVMSFNPHSVSWFKQHEPDLIRGIVSYDWTTERTGRIKPARRQSLASLADFELIGAEFISYNHAHLPLPVINTLREEGVPVLCWTVQNTHEAERAYLHADQITFENFFP